MIFQKAHRVFQQCAEKISACSAGVLRSRRGQASVVIMLIIAVALIVYAVVLNLSKVSQVKNATTIAANTAASLTGSLMASYGESILQTSLGGRTKKCGWTGVFAAIIAFIIIIIAIILAYPTGGASLTLLEVAAIVLAIALSLAAIVIQAAVVQPGITKLWNRMMESQLIPVDQFVERGIGQALQSAVSDNVLITDLRDLDIDGEWGVSTGGEPNDRVSRYAIYYTKRLRGIRPRAGAVFQNFFDAMDDLIKVKSSGDFGLWDPIVCTAASTNPACGTPTPTMYNSCCVEEPDICCDCSLWGSGPYPIVGPCTIEIYPDPPVFEVIEECGSALTCGTLPVDPFPGNTSTWTNPNTNEYHYNWYYAGEYQDDQYTPTNTRRSFRERMGIDDENPYWNRTYNSVNLERLYERQTLAVPPPALPYTGDNFSIRDTQGFYKNPIYALQETRDGIFSVLQKLSDWGVDLSEIDPATHPLHCHWCDRNNDPTCLGINTGLEELDSPAFGNVMSLPNPPEPVYNANGGWCVDSSNSILVPPVDKPIVLDLVGNVEDLITPEDECATRTEVLDSEPGGVSAKYGVTTDAEGVMENMYKKGADRWCSSNPTLSPSYPNPVVGPGGQPPYFARCEKQRNCADPDECVCSDVVADAVLWRDDSFDETIYGLQDFIQWADQSIAVQTEIQNNPTPWYPEAAYWLEPRLVGPTIQSRNGALWHTYYTMRNWQNRFLRWLNPDPAVNPLPHPGVPDKTTYEAANPNDAWCYPPLATSGPNTGFATYMSQTEKDTIAAAGGGVDAVLACLNFNANYSPPLAYIDPIVGPTTVTGNAERLALCANPFQCLMNWRVCSEEPRALGSQSVFDQRARVPLPDDTRENVDCLVGNPNAAVLPCDTTACNIVTMRPMASYALPPLTWDPNWCTVGAGGLCPANPNPWGPGHCVYDLILTDAINVGISAVPLPSCADGNYVNSLGVAAILAQNQVVKIRKRIAFLTNLKNDIELKILPVLTPAVNELHSFLIGPDDTICWNPITCADSPVEFMMAGYASYVDEPALPSQAIYVWQSESKTARPGPWHIVRADVRVPERCGNACGVSAPFNDPPWPSIRSYTKSAGTRRCYEITNTTGIVKVRVTRFDEDRPSGVLKFPFGQEIWQFRFFHPLAPQSTNVNTTIETKCLNLYGGPPVSPNPSFFDDTMIPWPQLGSVPADDPIKRAFILSDNDAGSPEWGYWPECWTAVNKILESGVVSESCAEYFLRTSYDADLGATRNCVFTSSLGWVCAPQNGVTGFGIKFVDCREGGRPFF